jgi:hypothetical protein
MSLCTPRVQVSLKAIALSIKPGADVGAIRVGGQVRTTGDNVITVEIDGDVGRIELAGGVVTSGSNSDAIHTRGNVPGLDEVSIHTANGQDIVLTAWAAPQGTLPDTRARPRSVARGRAGSRPLRPQCHRSR